MFICAVKHTENGKKLNLRILGSSKISHGLLLSHITEMQFNLEGDPGSSFWIATGIQEIGKISSQLLANFTGDDVVHQQPVTQTNASKLTVSHTTIAKRDEPTGVNKTNRCGIGLLLVKTVSNRVFVKGIATGFAGQHQLQLNVGDEIIAVDNAAVCEMTEVEIRNAILGVPGTTVDIAFCSYGSHLVVHASMLRRFPETTRPAYSLDSSPPVDPHFIHAESNLPAIFQGEHDAVDGLPCHGQPDDPAYFLPPDADPIALFGPDGPWPLDQSLAARESMITRDGGADAEQSLEDSRDQRLAPVSAAPLQRDIHTGIPHGPTRTGAAQHAHQRTGGVGAGPGADSPPSRAPDAPRTSAAEPAADPGFQLTAEFIMVGQRVRNGGGSDGGPYRSTLTDDILGRVRPLLPEPAVPVPARAGTTGARTAAPGGPKRRPEDVETALWAAAGDEGGRAVSVAGVASAAARRNVSRQGPPPPMHSAGTRMPPPSSAQAQAPTPPPPAPPPPTPQPPPYLRPASPPLPQRRDSECSAGPGAGPTGPGPVPTDRPPRPEPELRGTGWHLASRAAAAPVRAIPARPAAVPPLFLPTSVPGAPVTTPSPRKGLVQMAAVATQPLSPTPAIAIGAPVPPPPTSGYPQAEPGSAAAAPTSQWVRAGPRSPAPARSALTRLNISGKADPTRPKAVPPLDLASALVAGDDLGGPVPPAGVDAAGQSRGCVTGAGNAGARRLPARLPQRGLVDRGSLPPDPQRPMVVPPLALPEVLWG